MSKRIGSYPRVHIEGGGQAVVPQAGGVLLVETVRKAGLDRAVSRALAPLRRPRAVHDPGKSLLDVALAVTPGEDCLPGMGLLRAEPAVVGRWGTQVGDVRRAESLAAWPRGVKRATRPSASRGGSARYAQWGLPDNLGGLTARPPSLKRHADRPLRG
ncbi:transposase [Streptomyces sp. NBC_01724]|nr:transposase [Streptomyces sp. NBC_01620]WTE64548.1 transposase [Streptomyces sp. NBC_01617]WTI91833.1 transposase [Streptomyces sp. NBC_00724]